MAKPRCEGIVPEHTAVDPKDETGQKIITIKAARCKETATSVARHIQEEQQSGYHGVQYRVLGDNYYCLAHQKPGEYHHLDGSVTDHAIMAIEDA